MCRIEYYATIKIIKLTCLYLDRKIFTRAPTNYNHRKKVDSAIRLGRELKKKNWGENMKRQFIKEKI